MSRQYMATAAEWLAVYSSLLSRRTTIAAARPMFISRYWSDSCFCLATMLLLANEQLEHVLSRKERDEEQRHRRDSGTCIESGHGDTHGREDQERPDERLRFFSPEASDGTPVAESAGNAEQPEIGDLMHEIGDRAAEEQRPTQVVQGKIEDQPQAREHRAGQKRRDHEAAHVVAGYGP